MTQKFCFTNFNPEQQEIAFYEELADSKQFGYIVCQPEICPETGTPHVQGYAETSNKRRLKSLQQFIKCTWFVAKSKNVNQQNAYCLKPDSWAGTWKFQWGIPLPGQGFRTDLVAIQRAIKEDNASMEWVADNHFSDWVRYRSAFAAYKLMKSPKRDWKTHVHWIYGLSGLGKSRKAFWLMPKAYRKPGDTVWWDGYDGDEDVVIDNFSGKMPYEQMLLVMDRYPLSLQIKGGHVNFCAKRIIVTALLRPEEYYPEIHDKTELTRRIDTIEWIYEPWTPPEDDIMCEEISDMSPI